MKRTDQPDEQGILYRISAGDQEAFRRIFHAYSPKVYGFALKLTHSQTLAEEIVQDIFMKVWVGRASMASVLNFQAYLYTLTKNHAFNILKKIAVEKMAKTVLVKNMTKESNETEETVNYHESQQILNQAIDRLPPQQRLVYNMCYDEGLKYEEVAQRLNISRFTVKTHMQQALRTIKLHFNGFITLFILALITA